MNAKIITWTKPLVGSPLAKASNCMKAVNSTPLSTALMRSAGNDWLPSAASMSLVYRFGDMFMAQAYSKHAT